jgi:adhesin transport system outer membrane protein
MKLNLLHDRGDITQCVAGISMTIFIFGSLLLLASTSWAHETPRLMALDVIEQNPDVSARWHEFLARGQEVRQARGQYLPSVDVSAVGGRVEQRNGFTDEFNRREAQVSVTQLLFDGFRVRHEVGQAQQFQIINYYELLDVAQSTVLDALVTYHDVLRHRELVSLAGINYDNHQRVHDQIRSRAESGLSTSADLSQISGRLALAQSNLMTEQSNLHDISARYLRLAGELPAQTMTPLSLDATALPDSISDVMLQAYGNNPGFHASVAGIAAADEAVSLQESRYMPTVEFRIGHTNSRNANQSRSFIDSVRSENAAEVVFNYNLFRGGSDRASARAAHERANRARSLRDAACIDLLQTASIAHNDVRVLTSQLAVLRIHRDNSLEVVQAYHDQFSIGQRRLLDVLDAENEAFQAQRAYTHAEYNLLAAQLRTLAGMGQLLSTLDITRNELPSLSSLGLSAVRVDPSNACPRF